MTILTIEIPEKSKNTLADLIEQLGGKVISATDLEKKTKADKKSNTG